MDQSIVIGMLESVAKGELSPEDAQERLKQLPYEDLGFAKIDHHRSLRRGHSETIYAEGKTPEQVTAIVGSMIKHESNVLATRCDEATAEAVLAEHPQMTHHKVARCLTHECVQAKQLDGFVAVICAGTSDLPVAEEAATTAEFNGCQVKRIQDVGVAGLHRILDQRETLGGANVIVVCAGMEGALATVVAGLTDKPVIAVPTSVGYGASFEGVAALLGMLNSCATGVSVVNIDNGFGAGMNATIINRLAQKGSA